MNMRHLAFCLAVALCALPAIDAQAQTFRGTRGAVPAAGAGAARATFRGTRVGNFNRGPVLGGGFNNGFAAGGGFFNSFGYGPYSTLLYLRGDVPVPPYFALHPPVYYGQQVTRSYGSSPFAYGYPFYSGSECCHGEAAIQSNPYVPPVVDEESEEEETTISEKVARQNGVIFNPYYQPGPAGSALVAQ